MTGLDRLDVYFEVFIKLQWWLSTCLPRQPLRGGRLACETRLCTGLEVSCIGPCSCYCVVWERY